MSGLAIGDRAVRSRHFGDDDVAAYRHLSADHGLHFGDAAGGIPGPLLAGMISDLLGTELPGPGTMWMKQEMEFPTSAPIGSTVQASVEIARLRPDKGLVDLACRCTVNDTTVLSGRSVVLVEDLAARMG